MSSEHPKCSLESFLVDEQGLTTSEKNQDAQQKEILRRLAECKLNPHKLESFEEAELEKMIREISRKA